MSDDKTVVDDGSDIDAPLADETSWPPHVRLVLSPSGKYGLTVQSFEVTCVVRKAIHLLHGRLCFIHFFPPSTTLNAWFRKCLLGAARTLARNNMRTSERVGMRYNAVKERLKVDDKYASILSKLVKFP
jgi:hypothetical protein